MLKTLIKNEFKKIMRIGRYGNEKKKKMNPVVAYLLIMGFLGLFLAVSMYLLFSKITPIFRLLGVGWLGFSYAVIFAIVLSVVGGVFMAQSQLYRAKDNDLLLSLPIPPQYILFCRILPLYAQNFYFCFIVLLPAFIAYAVSGGISALGVVFFLLAVIVVPFFSLTLCCLLGFLVALIASRVKHGNIITVILSLIFFAVYFVVYMLFDNILSSLAESGGQVAHGIKAYAYPLYFAGRMIEGDAVGALVTAAICCGLFAILYLLLSKTYVGIITRKGVAAKSVYREKTLRRSSVFRTLIGRESKRFFRSTAYLLNCGLGVVLLFAAALFIAIGGSGIAETIQTELPEFAPKLAPLACALICLISAMDGITAPSVSLEGKSIYIMQSLPIESWKPLFAKIAFHVIFNTPMTIICGIVAAIVFPCSALGVIMLIIMPIAVNILVAALGLVFNLKKPVLEWQNETAVIKQSISVLFLMLSVFAIFGSLMGLYFAARYIMSADVYLVVCFLLISIGAVFAVLWLKKRGVRIWENL